MIPALALVLATSGAARMVKTPDFVTSTVNTPDSVTATTETPDFVTSVEDTPEFVSSNKETPESVTSMEETPDFVTSTEETPEYVTSVEEMPEFVTSMRELSRRQLMHSCRKDLCNSPDGFGGKDCVSCSASEGMPCRNGFIPKKTGTQRVWWTTCSVYTCCEKHEFESKKGGKGKAGGIIGGIVGGICSLCSCFGWWRYRRKMKNKTKKVQQTCTFTKLSKTALCGINFQRKDGTICVLSINAAGAAAGCGLEVGDEVLSINGVNVTSAQQGADLLKEAEGEVKLIVDRIVKATELTYRFTKPSKTALCGINFQRKDGTTSVSSLDEEGAAAGCGLKVDDMVLFINRNGVKSPKQAADLLKDAEGEVNIIVIRFIVDDEEAATPAKAAGQDERVQVPTGDTPRERPLAMTAVTVEMPPVSSEHLQPTKKFCGECGTPRVLSSAFCGECGTRYD